MEYPVSFPSAPQRLSTSGVTVKQGNINLPCPSYASRTPHPSVPSRLTHVLLLCRRVEGLPDSLSKKITFPPYHSRLFLKGDIWGRGGGSAGGQCLFCHTRVPVGGEGGQRKVKRFVNCTRLMGWRVLGRLLVAMRSHYKDDGWRWWVGGSEGTWQPIAVLSTPWPPVQTANGTVSEEMSVGCIRVSLSHKHRQERERLCA